MTAIHDISPINEASLRTSRIVHVLLVLLVVVCAGVIAGCGENERLTRITPIAGQRVTVHVTTDAGSELVIRKTLRLTKSMTALSALDQVADVRMAPGGVVAQVNGLGGGAIRTFGPEQAGWFYRIDGVEGNTDPARQRLSPGESVWWDLRRFDIYERIPVAIGVFPEPLFSGYRDTVRPLRISYGRGFKKDAEFFRDEVFKQVDPEVVPIRNSGGLLGSDEESNEDRPVAHVAVRPDRANLVIGRWEEVRLDPFIADIGFDPRAYGLTTWIEGTDIRRQWPQDEFSRELDSAEGVVWASTADGEPDGPLVFLVTGLTDEGVRAAAKALSRGGFQFSLSGAVNTEGKVLD